MAETYPGEKHSDFDLQLYMTWTAAVQDQSTVMWIAPELVGPIVESADSVPELGDFDELRIPETGLIVLGDPVTNPDDEMAISVLSWAREIGANGEPSLNLNPGRMYPSFEA